MPDAAVLERSGASPLFPVTGRVLRLAAGEIEASGPDAPIAAHCEVIPADGARPPLLAEVVAAGAEAIRLVPFGSVAGVRIGDRVRMVADDRSSRVGAALAGRALDALGGPLDGGPPPRFETHRSPVPRVLDRVPPGRPLATGIRAIDGLLTLGRGQRIGIFAASGVGKTRLIEQVVRQADCERVVICLIGERGREVEALWSEVKGSDRLARTALVAATSDESAPMRAQALEQALAMAEFWRDRGEHVLLVADSVTRHAMALREIGLVAGEPPMVRAYTPNVLRELPRLVERCGAVRGRGSITGLFTVLSEGDDVDDPIVEVMKSLLDGHIVLSRRLAEAGHFPAIDVNRSLSRLFDRLVDDRQAQAARVVRALLAKYEESRILVESGLYKPGSDKALDRAVAARETVLAFLCQADGAELWTVTLDRLASLAEGSG